MGKYVLLEFDDDAQAETLIARVNSAASQGKKYKVIGIFQKPPKRRCECPDRTTANRVSTQRRHKKTGFTYCIKCKRVWPGWQAPRNFLDMLNLPVNYFSKGLTKEAQVHMDHHGENLIKNYPITDRLVGWDRP